jgi:hypothetical protein
MPIERLRFPDLEAVAAPDEGGELAEAGVLDQARRQQNAALAVERQLLGVAEQRGRQVVMGVGEQFDVAHFGKQFRHPVQPCALDRGILEGRERDDAVERVAGQRRPERRRHRDAALAVHLVGEGVDEQSHRRSRGFPRVFRCLIWPGPGRAGPGAGVSANAVVWYGISWVHMGVNGNVE